MSIEYLLLQSTRYPGNALKAISHCLERMSRGGIYDVVGGGFHRHSTDYDWLIPHFEKMLCDNAQLAKTYLHAYQRTQKEEFKWICEDILDFIVRELFHPQGGFFCSLDADSAGREGEYYLWEKDKVLSLFVENEDREIFCHIYDLRP